MIGHIGPEAAVGGPIAAVQDGDEIEVNLDKFELNVKISDEEMAERLEKWSPKPPPYKSGVLSKYIKLVNPASTGATTS